MSLMPDPEEDNSGLYDPAKLPTSPDNPSLAAGVRWGGHTSALAPAAGAAPPTAVNPLSVPDQGTPDDRRRIADKYVMDTIKNKTGISIDASQVQEMMQTGRVQMTAQTTTTRGAQRVFENQLALHEQLRKDEEEDRKARADQGWDWANINAEMYGVSLDDLTAENRAQKITDFKSRYDDLNDDELSDELINRIFGGETVRIAVSTLDGRKVDVAEGSLELDYERLHGWDEERTTVDEDGNTITTTHHIYGDLELKDMYQTRQFDFEALMNSGGTYRGADGVDYELLGAAQTINLNWENSEKTRIGYKQINGYYDRDGKFVAILENGELTYKDVVGSGSEEIRLRDRALNLQEAGMESEDAWRQAQAENDERRLTGFSAIRSTTLLDIGMSAADIEGAVPGMEDLIRSITGEDGEIDSARVRNLEGAALGQLNALVEALAGNSDGDIQRRIRAVVGRDASTEEINRLLSGGSVAAVDEDGNVISTWIEGTMGLEERKIALQRELSDSNLTYQQQRDFLNKQHEKDMTNGYWSFDSQRGYQWVMGTADRNTQAIELSAQLQITRDQALQFLADQSREGYSRYVDVTGPGGRTWKQLVHIAGSNAQDVNMQEARITADREQFDDTLEWQQQQREGYFSDHTGEWVAGTVENEQTMLKLNAELTRQGITLQDYYDTRNRVGYDKWVPEYGPNGAVVGSKMVHIDGTDEVAEGVAQQRQDDAIEFLQEQEGWESKQRNGYFGPVRGDGQRDYIPGINDANKSAEDRRAAYEAALTELSAEQRTDAMTYEAYLSARDRTGYDMWVEETTASGARQRLVHVKGSDVQISDQQEMARISEFGGYVVGQDDEDGKPTMVWHEGDNAHQVTMAAITERFRAADWGRTEATAAAQYVRSHTVTSLGLIEQSYKDARRTFHQSENSEATSAELDALVASDWESAKDGLSSSTLTQTMEDVRAAAVIEGRNMDFEDQLMLAMVSSGSNLAGSVLGDIANWFIGNFGGDSDPASSLTIDALKRQYPDVPEADLEKIVGGVRGVVSKFSGESVADTAASALSVVPMSGAGGFQVVNAAGKAVGVYSTEAAARTAAAASTTTGAGAGFFTSFGVTVGALAGAAAVGYGAYRFAKSLWGTGDREASLELRFDQSMDGMSRRDRSQIEAMFELHDYDTGNRDQVQQYIDMYLESGSGDPDAWIQENLAPIEEYVGDNFIPLMRDILSYTPQDNARSLSSTFRGIVDDGILSLAPSDVPANRINDMIMAWNSIPSHMQSEEVDRSAIERLNENDDIQRLSSSQLILVMNDMLRYTNDMHIMNSEEIGSSLKTLFDDGVLSGTDSAGQPALTTVGHINSIDMIYNQFSEVMDDTFSVIDQMRTDDPTAAALVGNMPADLSGDTSVPDRKKRLLAFYNIINAFQSNPALGEYLPDLTDFYVPSDGPAPAAEGA